MKGFIPEKSMDEPTQARNLTRARIAKTDLETGTIEHPQEESHCARPAERDSKLAMKKHMLEKSHPPAQNVTRILTKMQT